MKIGINTHLATDNFSEDILVGVAEVELSEEEIIKMFGYSLKYNDVHNLLNSRPSNGKEIVVKKFGNVTLKIFHLED